MDTFIERIYDAAIANKEVFDRMALAHPNEFACAIYQVDRMEIKGVQLVRIVSSTYDADGSTEMVIGADGMVQLPFGECKGGFMLNGWHELCEDSIQFVGPFKFFEITQAMVDHIQSLEVK